MTKLGLKISETGISPQFAFTHGDLYTAFSHFVDAPHRCSLHPTAMATNWPSNWPAPADELNIFDAEGDVLFILTRSTLKHATIEEDYTEFESSEPLPPKEEDDAIIPEFPPSFDVDVIMETELSGYTRASQADLIPAPSTSRIDVSIDIHLRASSKHLTHASPISHRMLGPDFKEGGILKAQGSVAIPLPDDDPDAMIILLNIIHGRTRQVPRSIGFGTMMLTELATLVDYYHIFEVVELFSDTWLQNSLVEGHYKNRIDTRMHSSGCGSARFSKTRSSSRR